MKVSDLEPWLRAFMIGDAYGAGFEMRPEGYVEEFNDGLTYRAHGLDTAHRPGMTTDDTQMTLAVRSTLAESYAGRWQFARAFCNAYRRSKAPGYGRRMQERFALALETSDPATTLVDIGKHDALSSGLRDTCGAAMRALPCGLCASHQTAGDAADTAYEQARVTHHHPDSIDAALSVTMAARAAVEGNDGDAALVAAAHWVQWPSPHDWDSSQWLRGSTSGKVIVMAALGLLASDDSLHRLLVKSVALGGDVDTLAALTLGIGALFPDRWEYDLPASLEEGLIIPEGV